MTDIIDQLRALRLDQGLQQPDLAKLMNVTGSQVSNLETRRHSPTLAVVQRWAAALGTILTVVETPTATDENPRLGWDEEPDTDVLDEFVATDVKMVHFEALDNCAWYANIYMNDGQIWTLNFGSVSGRAKGYANAERVE